MNVQSIIATKIILIMTMHIHLFNPNSPLWTQSSTEKSPHQFSYLHLQRPFLCTSSWDFWKHNFFTAQVKKKSFKKKKKVFQQNTGVIQPPKYS